MEINKLYEILEKYNISYQGEKENKSNIFKDLQISINEKENKISSEIELTKEELSKIGRGLDPDDDEEIEVNNTEEKKEKSKEIIKDEPIEGLNENLNNLFYGLLNNYKEYLNNQINYIKQESAIGVFCKDQVKFFNDDNKCIIKFKECCDFIPKILFNNGENYYKILSKPDGLDLYLKEIKDYLITEFKKFPKDEGVNDSNYLKVKEKLLDKSKVVILNEFMDKTVIKFIIYCYDKEIDKKVIESKHYFEADKPSKTIEDNIDSKYNEMHRYTFAKFSDEEAYNQRPFFATRVKDYIVEGLKKPMFNPIIGRKYDNSIFKLNFNAATITEKFVFLVAGSRSGKGVLTLCQLAEALARGYNTFYIDCKPDMAKNLYNDFTDKETFAIDGFTIAKDKRLNIKIQNKPYEEYAKEKLEETIQGITQIIPDINLFINLLGYTRAIHDIVTMGTQQALNNPEYGKTPCFIVIDEIEQYSKALDRMFFENEQLSKNKYGGMIGEIINNPDTDTKTRKYLINIIKYIRDTWFSFGNMSQSILGQSLLKIFVICQHTHIDTWCKPVKYALSLYAGQAQFILGNESQAGFGSSKYGCAGLDVGKDKNPGDYLGTGKFIWRKGGESKGTPFKSIFLINSSTRDEDNHPSNYLAEVYGRLSSDGVRRLVNRELFNEDNTKTFEELENTPLINTSIGFKEFTNYLIKQKGKDKDITYYLQKGYKYLMRRIYNNKEVWSQFYDYSYNGLGIKENIDTEFINKIENLLQSKEFICLLDERYIKIYKEENRYEINSVKYLEFLKSTRNNNKLWDIYEKQSTGNISKDEASNEVTRNKNLFQNLLNIKGQYKPKTLKEERDEKLKAELDLYINESKLNGIELTDQDIEQKKEELIAKLDEQYADANNEIIIKKEILKNLTTEYYTCIENIVRQSYRQIFNKTDGIVELQKENNRYYIINSEACDLLAKDGTGLFDIYEQQLGQEDVGPCSTKEEADKQKNVFKALTEIYKIIKNRQEKENNDDDSEDEDQQINTIYTNTKSKSEDKLSKKDNGKLNIYSEGQYNGLIVTKSKPIPIIGNGNNKNIKDIIAKFNKEWSESPLASLNKINKSFTANLFNNVIDEKTNRKLSLDQIVNLRLTDNEIIINNQRFCADQYFYQGFTNADLFDVRYILRLRNLQRLQISFRCFDKIRNEFKLYNGNAIVETAKYLFKNLKKLDELYIIEEDIFIKRSTIHNYEDADTPEGKRAKSIDNKINKNEYINAMDIGMMALFGASAYQAMTGKQVQNIMNAASNPYHNLLNTSVAKYFTQRGVIGTILTAPFDLINAVGEFFKGGSKRSSNNDDNDDDDNQRNRRRKR